MPMTKGFGAGDVEHYPPPYRVALFAQLGNPAVPSVNANPDYRSTLGSAAVRREAARQGWLPAALVARLPRRVAAPR